MKKELQNNQTKLYSLKRFATNFTRSHFSILIQKVLKSDYTHFPLPISHSISYSISFSFQVSLFSFKLHQSNPQFTGP